MSLSSRVKNKIVDTINTTFASLGHANGMRMPKSQNNHEAVAWELWTAKHVLSLAEKRKDAAERAAAQAGVINDKERDPLPAGTRAICYHGDIVDVQVEVRNASKRVNVDVMADYLVGKGVKQSLVDAARSAATKETKPAHVFTPMLVTEDVGK